MNKKFSPHLEMAHAAWRDLLQKGDLAIDATLSNGHDAFFLSRLGAEVIALDIQPKALEQAGRLLEGTGVQLVQMSHAQIDSLSLPKKPKLIVYNLGYLPGGDKSLTTTVSSTLESVEKSLRLLEKNGALSITCYPGHDEGEREEKALVEWARGLASEKWTVCHHQWINKARSPSLLWIVELVP